MLLCTTGVDTKHTGASPREQCRVNTGKRTAARAGARSLGATPCSSNHRRCAPWSPPARGRSAAARAPSRQPPSADASLQARTPAADRAAGRSTVRLTPGSPCRSASCETAAASVVTRVRLPDARGPARTTAGACCSSVCRASAACVNGACACKPASAHLPATACESLSSSL